MQSLLFLRANRPLGDQTMLRRIPFLAMLCLPLTFSAASAGESDADGDGLSDFQETHKYRTNPREADSDGDGTPDGDWHERREYAYSIRSVVKVLRPCNTQVVNDDFQDARVLKKNERWVELEVIHYPLNTIGKSIRGKRKWTAGVPRSLQVYLKPGVTTNWDAKLRADVFKALRADGLNVEKMSDAEAVRRVAKWLFGRAKYRYMFSTYFLHFPKGQAEILPGLESAYRREPGNTELPFAKQNQHEVFGKGMFYNRSHGTCTSSAIYLTTCLRAIGIPCRMVLAIPVVDSNDPIQLSLIERGITNHRMRRHLLRALRTQRGFASHTFNEVHVGGRWHRLNYSQLGANIDSVFGMMTHVNTFNDLSEAGLTKTWGKRYGTRQRDNVFKTSNPYRTTELSDQIGRHSKLSNPKVDIKEHQSITITKAYWHDSQDAPPLVRGYRGIKRDGAGHLFVHGKEWFRGEPYTQYKIFMSLADPNFQLVADGLPKLKGRLSTLYITHGSKGVHEIEIRIAPDEFKKMRRGVSYRLVPVNSVKKHRWRVANGVRVTIGEKK